MLQLHIGQFTSPHHISYNSSQTNSTDRWDRSEQKGINLLHSSLAPGTHATYDKGWKNWSSFCNNNHLDPLLLHKASDYDSKPRLFIFEVAVVIAYLVYCFYVLKLAATTIDNYLHGASFHLKASGRDCGFLTSFPVLQTKKALYVQCRQRVAASETGSLPVTMSMIQKYKQKKSIDCYENHGIYVALVMAFTMLLRISEYAIVSSKHNIPHHLRAKDIFFTVHDIQIPAHELYREHLPHITAVTIKLRSCKNDQEGGGHIFSFQRIFNSESSDQCLCSIMSSWAIRARLNPDDLFLSYRQSWKISPAKIAQAVKFMARVQGFQDTRFSTHSLRYGGATALAAAGTPDSWIQTFGRWRSLAFLKYIKLSGRIFQQIQNIVMDPDTVSTTDIARLLN